MTIALVTGANRGIGLETARQLAQHGITVILTAREHEKARAAADSLSADGLTVFPKVVDVADDASVRALAAEIEAEFGHIDILINNAAVYADWGETVTSADLATVHALFETNFFGAWRMCQAFVPLLRKSAGGRIVNVSSGAGSHTDTRYGLKMSAGTASYSVSKAALNALTVKLALELAKTNILVNAVCPGFTATYPGMESMGARPVADGAAGIVWAALLPDGGSSGGFFRDGKPLGW